MDALRVLAALTVVLFHLSYERFTGADMRVVRDLNLGPDAVILFFVNSGFVISHAAGRDRTLGR